PETGFYIVGMKSYGRAPTFLMATGYEQVRSIAAALAGDRAAADDVHLDLPETGVCSTDLGGSCDAPATPQLISLGATTSTSSCCVKAPAMPIDAPELAVHVLQRTADDLARTYEGMFSAETIERYVFESYTALARTATIKRYLAALARNFASDRLRALALSQGKIQSTVPQVLFVCVHNAGRSQVAAALLKHYAGSDVEVRSAGSLPASEVDPQVAEVLKARGIDMTGAFPKPLTDDVVRAA